MRNPYTDEIVRVIEKQTDKGIRKYGANLQDNPLELAPEQIVAYALEEVADTMVYLCKLKEMLGGGLSSKS